MDEASIRKSLERKSSYELRQIATGEVEGYRSVAIKFAAEILQERGEPRDPMFVTEHKQNLGRQLLGETLESIAEEMLEDHPRERLLRNLVIVMRGIFIIFLTLLFWTFDPRWLTFYIWSGAIISFFYLLTWSLLRHELDQSINDPNPDSDQR